MVRLKIGDFARLGQVSIRLLRYYDEIGLLKPVHIDEWTGYRTYALDQLPRLNRILAFKDLGFSLEQISDLLTDKVSAEQIEGMLRLKQMELERQVQEEQERLAQVAYRLKQMHEEGTISNYDIVVKRVERQWVAGIRDKIASFPEVGRLIDELYLYLETQGGGGYDGAIWYDSQPGENQIDAEGIGFLEHPIPPTPRVAVYQLPAVETMATVLHHGSYNNLNKAYTAILSWIERNGYKIVGPYRDIYLHGGDAQDDESFITEVQFPVEKEKESQHEHN